MQKELWKILPLVLLSVIFLRIVFPFLDSLIIAAVFAYMSLPLRDKLEKKVGRSASLLIVVILGILITSILFYISFTLVSIISRSLEYFSTELSTVLEKWKFEKYYPLIETRLNALIDLLSAKVGSLVRGTWIVFVKVFIFLFSFYYFLQDGRRLVKKFTSKVEGFFTPDQRKEFGEILDQLDRVYKGLFIGYLLNGIFLALLAWAQFWVLGISYPEFLALLAFITGVLPILDPWMFYIPISLWQIFIQENIWFGLGILFLSFFTLNVLPAILIPQITKRTAKVHPMVALVAFLGGPWAFGISGLVIGPVIVGLIYVLAKFYIK